MQTVESKRARFAGLHSGPGCFIMPNPWDIGSAKYLASLGFKALATTNAGAAFALGKADGAMTRAEVLRHIGDIAAATELPCNADYEAGFGASRDELYESVARCIGAGVAGFSIEDFTGDPKSPFYAPREAADRIRTARAAINASGQKVLLTARAESLLRGHPDGLPEAIRRLDSYAEAGADVLYAPGLRTADDVAAVVKVAGKLPVNVLVGAPGFTFSQLEDLGVRRISVGGALARVAWGAFMRAAIDIAQNGRFDCFANAAPFAEITRAFDRS
jgi:2-methylisocitrate lyase-like PEP mutase family enzyme